MNKMTLTIPARPEWGMVLRMVASGVSAVFDLPLDVMDDLRTALDESCELLMHQPVCISSLSLTCEADAAGLHVVLSAQRCDKVQEENHADADIAGLIIGTLVKQVKLLKDDSGVNAVEMLLPAKAHGC